MISRYIALFPILGALLAGCASHPTSHLTELNTSSHIAYMDGKYRVCRSSCPQRTPKYLDDSEYIAMTAHQSQSAPDQNGVQNPSVSVTQNTPVKPIETDVYADNTGRIYEIHFEFGKNKPTKEGQQTLKLLPEASKNATSIELLGETDSIGTQNFNDKLAFARAHFVARWLKEHGATTKITIESKGMCCLASPYNKTNETLEQMRRVIVRLSIQPKKESKK